MFKIESYITSIILANADRYIRNFRKQDAQVSLWEGDATFHNIDLNVDALNEELQSSFVFTSGYIHDLIIHVPWTKLMSEPVTISVNTIECVMRLKSQDEKNVQAQGKSTSVNPESTETNDKRSNDEISNQSSYTSALTSKIMNNLSIRCENVILKLVEEDIVFSMNIEKLTFDNVNENWIQAMTEVNVEKLLTRKLIALSGVTICFDKQNSSGRIDTYLEPLLYRCQIHIRLLRAYNHSFSKKPAYSRFDILSDKMSFTISEPQIPMLLKLGVLIFCSNDNPSTVHSRSLSFNSDTVSTKSEGSHLYDETAEDNAEMTSWGNWLWNMIPSILPQDEEISTQNIDAHLPCTFHVGFYVKCLETSLKVLSHRVKKSSKIEFDHLLKSTFNGCIYEMLSRNSEWLNVQFGVNYVSVEMPTEEMNDNSQKNQFIIAGADSTLNFAKDTLFDEEKFNLKIQHQNQVDCEEPNSPTEKDGSNDDFQYQTDFSLDGHLNLNTEHVLLEKTQAFAIDYVKTYQVTRQILRKENENEEATRFSDNESVDDFVAEPKSRRLEKHILLRFVFGSTVIKVCSDFVDSLRYLHKIIPFNEYSTLQQTSTAGMVESDVRLLSKYHPNHTTQFTFFDLVFEFYLTLSRNQLLNASRSDSTFTEIPVTMTSPVLVLSCKCIDGKINTIRNPTPDASEEIKKITMLKAVELVCFIVKLGQKTQLLKCQKFDWELTYDLNNTSKELHIETRNLTMSSSKQNFLLSYYICNYTWASLFQLEQKMNYFSKIFHSSLIEDSYFPGNVILELSIENIVLKYNSLKETVNINFLVKNCKAFANELKNDFQKRVIIFNAAETSSESSCIRVIIQRCKNWHKQCNYPSCIWFNVCNLKINMDVIIYSWITYQPDPILQENISPTINKSNKEQSVSNLSYRSAPSRKISEGNCGSHGRRYSSNFPKPKESVHSSSEHEAVSPPIITETETSDIFQLPTPAPSVKKETTWIEYLKNDIQLWRSLVIYGDVSRITIYIPTNEFAHHNESDNIEHFIKESFKNHPEQNSKLGVFVVALKSAKIKCDVSLNVLEELNSEKFISFSKIGWSADKLTFPWTISLSEISVSSLLENCVCKPLLKPLSANCTVGITIKEGTESESIIALCVHADFQPIIITLTDKQVNLITETIAALVYCYKNLRKIASSKVLPNELALSQSQTENMVYDKVQNKLTGWIQWTFTKCSVILYNKRNAELKKLSIELEDSIMSLEFDDIFHKMKLKVASFGIYHHTRQTRNDPWQNGPFHGVIVQRSYSQPLSNDKKVDEDGDDRFILATITRAKSNNLKTRLLPAQISSESLACSSDRFVTEIILKICATDVIIPLSILETFIAVLIPVKKLFRANYSYKTETIDSGSKDQTPFTCLPLVYCDVPKIRIFVPLSSGLKIELNNLNDTFVCEVGSAHLDCHPENPIIRKPLRPELYFAMSGKSFTSIESKLQNQQYQLIISDVSVNTGIWREIQKMLEKEHLSVEEPPSAFEQNPAVMWNQGCQPDTKHKINLRHLSPIVSKFTCKILLAPSVESYSLKTIVQRAQYEIAVLSDVNVTVSLNQIILLVLIHKEFMSSVFPYFEIGTETTINVNYSSDNYNGKSKIIDSGIESMDQSSVESSSVIKNKSGHANSVNSKVFYSAASSNISSFHQQSGYYLRFENAKEIYISMQNINFIVYKTCEIKENDEVQIAYDPLICAEIVQPYVLLNYENNFSSLQFSIFNMSIKLPIIRSVNSYFAHIPSSKDFPKLLLHMKKSNCDSYSKIKYPCFTLKTALDLNKRWKNEVLLGQPLLINCDINAIRYLISAISSCSRECENLLEIFEQVQEKRDQGIQTCESDIKFIDKYKRYFNLVCNSSVTTSRIVLAFKCGCENRNLLLNIDGIDLKARTPCVVKNLSESICLQGSFKCISILLPEIRSVSLSDLFSEDGTMQKLNDLLSNMILKPWNVNVEIFAIFYRWNLFDENPWTCLKIHSENIVFEINPLYLDFVSNLVSEYWKLYETYSPKREKTIRDEKHFESSVSENYKDDLRAGAFQYIKNEVDRYALPSPYEVVFCNRPLQPYMCWRYPQPRCLTKLQIYPVPVEDMNEDYLEEEIRCQLQYYDELRGTFLPHVSFNLSENSIQTVNLPDTKPYTNAAECWRIVLYDMTDSRENVNNLRIDVRSLAGCVRVDSSFQPSLVPERQILINVSEIQVNFSTFNRNDLHGIENYTIFYQPTKQHFLSAICNDLKIFISNYNDNEDKTVEISGIFKANVLNYEYLMFQSFVDPVFFECAVYFTGNTTPKMTGLVKNVRIHVSPNFIHTLSISKDLWNDWKPNSFSQCKIASHYAICNNTNHIIEFRQENSSVKTFLPPFWCDLYAWRSPALPKNITIAVSTENRKFHSGPVQVKKVGCHNVICETAEKTELSHLFVSVIKHSSVVNQIIIYGNLLIYNLTHSEMDMVMISHGKRDAKFSYSQTINSTTTIKKNQLLSIVVPDSHKLSFKVRYRPSQNSSDNCYWSGLIPLVTFQQPSNQNSWMVKVPLKNLKENFQSLWCQVTREVIDNVPKYLVVFRPLCTVISFLPWKSHVQVVNDVDSVVSSGAINDKGAPTELFIPNTVTLDKFSIEWKPTQENEKYSKKIFIDKLPKQKSPSQEWSIHSLIEEISVDMEDNKWPFLNVETSRFTWKTDRVYEITPAVFRKEENGCGTKIEIYPWAIIVNMLNYKVLLDISDTIYTIDSYEIIAPPRIESTFKLGIVDGKDYLSGVLQLSDDQSFPIPKVTGRIPMNGFVTTIIECDAYVTFVNITSRNYKEMRIISMCSSYVISNNCSLDVSCTALVVCRTGNRSSASFDAPDDLETMSVELPAKQNSTVAQPIAKWYKIGKGDVQVLPYLILSIKGNSACPVRICDLSEKQRYSILFSCANAEERPPCIFMTAQQNQGQVFLTIWDEKVPQIVVHNMSQLPLNITSSKSDRASAEVAYCPDWNWKFSIVASSTGYFHIPQQVVENKKKALHYLKFSVKNSKPVKQSKWSCGVLLKPCVNQLITLPLSQHHIKLAIFKDGFTYVVWIESATSDELSAKMIRTRLSESFLPINSGGVPLASEFTTSHVEDPNEIPPKLIDLYSRGKIKPYDLNVVVEQISLTLACDDENTFVENDVTTFSMEGIKINLSAVQRPNEVKEDICCDIDIARYRVDNEQFHLRTFDFPVVLLSKSPRVDEHSKFNYSLRDLLLAFKSNDYSAMKIIIAFNSENLFVLDVRDLDVSVNSQNIFLEDKYLKLLRTVFENIFSATYDSSLLCTKSLSSDLAHKNEIGLVTEEMEFINTSHFIKDGPESEFPAKPKSSSSKSVNISENDTDDKSYNSMITAASNLQVDDNFPCIATADVDEIDGEVVVRSQRNENFNFSPVPANVIALSRRIAKPLRLRSIRISTFCATVSLHTSTTFYIALDRSPLNFSEFKKDYLITTPFELGNLLTVHYFFGAVYGTGWAISSLEFVGSPGVLARTVGTGIKDFVSMPIYGIASGPRGFVLGVAHGSASLMKHVMAGTLSSVTKFAGSWARTLDRFTLDPDDLLQSEEIRRFPPNSIAEGVLQGLTEFGISVLGGISGLAHHPLQYAVSNTGNRSLINSISLGIVGVLTRPLSGAAELVAKTGQGILSHVGWNTVPTIRNGPICGSNFSHLQICALKYQWKSDNDDVLLAIEAVSVLNVAIPLWITLTSTCLNIVSIADNGEKITFDLTTHEFRSCDADPTLIIILKPTLNLKSVDDFRKARIMKFVNETNHYCNIENSFAGENTSYHNEMETISSFYVNPRVKNFLLNMISFVKNISD